MGSVLELRTARTAPDIAGRALATAAESAAARLLTEIEIAKARLDKSFCDLRSEDPLAAEVYALRRAVSALSRVLGERAPRH